jgi:hypothetical protein
MQASLLQRSGVLEMLDVGIGPRVHEAFVAGVAPSNAIWRPAVETDLQNLGIPSRLADSMWVDDQAISWCSLHGVPSLASGRIGSVGKLVDLCRDGHVDVSRVVVNDVILDFVVSDEAELAVRALPWFVAHGSILRHASTCA